MKTIMLLLFLLCHCALWAQHVVATSGDTFSNVRGSISYTIGEGVAQTLTKGDNTLTQGFHQTIVSVAVVTELKELDFSISAFPNPTTDQVKLKVGKEDLSGLQYLLFDISGKLISKKNIESNDTSVPFQYLPVGSYILQVLDGKMELKTFKIIKR